jgi:hypothetical protein
MCIDSILYGFRFQVLWVLEDRHMYNATMVTNKKMSAFCTNTEIDKHLLTASHTRSRDLVGT